MCRPGGSGSRRCRLPWVVPADRVRVRPACPREAFGQKLEQCLRAPFFQLAHRHLDAFQNLHGLEPCNDYWGPVTVRDRFVFLVAHHCADMTCGEEGIHAVVRFIQHGLEYRRHANVRNQHREVWQPEPPRFPQHCLRSDRLSAYEQWSLPYQDALRNELRRGIEVIESGETVAGATSFARGQGRHGAF